MVWQVVDLTQDAYMYAYPVYVRHAHRSRRSRKKVSSYSADVSYRRSTPKSRTLRHGLRLRKKSKFYNGLTVLRLARHVAIHMWRPWLQHWPLKLADRWKIGKRWNWPSQIRGNVFCFQKTSRFFGGGSEIILGEVSKFGVVAQSYNPKSPLEGICFFRSKRAQ